MYLLIYILGMKILWDWMGIECSSNTLWIQDIRWLHPLKLIMLHLITFNGDIIVLLLNMRDYWAFLAGFIKNTVLWHTYHLDSTYLFDFLERIFSCLFAKLNVPLLTLVYTYTYSTSLHEFAMLQSHLKKFQPISINSAQPCNVI